MVVRPLVKREAVKRIQPWRDGKAPKAVVPGEPYEEFLDSIAESFNGFYNDVDANLESFKVASRAAISAAKLNLIPMVPPEQIHKLQDIVDGVSSAITPRAVAIANEVEMHLCSAKALMLHYRHYVRVQTKIHRRFLFTAWSIWVAMVEGLREEIRKKLDTPACRSIRKRIFTRLRAKYMQRWRTNIRASVMRQIEEAKQRAEIERLRSEVNQLTMELTAYKRDLKETKQALQQAEAKIIADNKTYVATISEWEERLATAIARHREAMEEHLKKQKLELEEAATLRVDEVQRRLDQEKQLVAQAEQRLAEQEASFQARVAEALEARDQANAKSKRMRKDRSEQVIARMNARTLNSFFKAWSASARRRIYIRRVLTKKEGIPVKRAFRNWLEYTQEILEAHKNTAVSLRKAQHRRLGEMWGRWRDFTGDRRSAFARGEHCFQRKRLGSVLLAWFHVAERLVVERRKIHNFQRKACVLQAYSGWMEAMGIARAEVRRAAEEARLSSAVNEVHKQATEERKALAIRIFRRQTKNMHRSILRQWLLLSEREEARSGELLAKARAKLKPLVLRWYFSRWTGRCSECQQFTDGTMSSAKRAEILRRARNFRVGYYLVYWHELTLSRARRRRLCSRGVQRYQRRLQGAAMEEWFEECTAQGAQARLPQVRACLRRVRKAAALSCWRGRVHYKFVMRYMARRADRVFLRRMCQRWQTGVTMMEAEKAERSQKAKLKLDNIGNAVLLRYWRTWHKAVKKNLQHRKITKMLHQRRKWRRFKGAFQQLRAHVRSRQEQRVLLRRADMLRNRFLKDRALSAMADYVHETNAKKEMLVKAYRHAENVILLAPALEIWRDALEQAQRELDAKVERALSLATEHVRRKVPRCWAWWAKWMTQKKVARMRDKMNLRHVRNRRCARVFQAWAQIAYCDSVTMTPQSVERADAFLNAKLLEKALRAWRAFLALQQDWTTVHGKVKRVFEKGLLRRAVRAWSNSNATLRRERAREEMKKLNMGAADLERLRAGAKEAADQRDKLRLEVQALQEQLAQRADLTKEAAKEMASKLAKMERQLRELQEQREKLQQELEDVKAKLAKAKGANKDQAAAHEQAVRALEDQIEQGVVTERKLRAQMKAAAAAQSNVLVMARRSKQNALAKTLVGPLKLIQRNLKDWMKMGKMHPAERNSYEETKTRVESSCQLLNRVANVSEEVVSGAKDDGWPKETGGKEGRIEQSIEDAQKAVADELHRLYSHMQKLFADSESSRRERDALERQMTKDSEAHHQMMEMSRERIAQQRESAIAELQRVEELAGRKLTATLRGETEKIRGESHKRHVSLAHHLRAKLVQSFQDGEAKLWSRMRKIANSMNSKAQWQEWLESCQQHSPDLYQAMLNEATQRRLKHEAAEAHNVHVSDEETLNVVSDVDLAPMPGPPVPGRPFTAPDSQLGRGITGTSPAYPPKKERSEADLKVATADSSIQTDPPIEADDSDARQFAVAPESLAFQPTMRRTKPISDRSGRKRNAIHKSTDDFAMPSPRLAANSSSSLSRRLSPPRPRPQSPNSRGLQTCSPPRLDTGVRPGAGGFPQSDRLYQATGARREYWVSSDDDSGPEMEMGQSGVHGRAFHPQPKDPHDALLGLFKPRASRRNQFHPRHQFTDLDLAWHERGPDNEFSGGLQEDGSYAGGTSNNGRPATQPSSQDRQFSPRPMTPQGETSKRASESQQYLRPSHRPSTQGYLRNIASAQDRASPVQGEFTSTGTQRGGFSQNKGAFSDSLYVGAPRQLKTHTPGQGRQPAQNRSFQNRGRREDGPRLGKNAGLTIPMYKPEMGNLPDLVGTAAGISAWDKDDHVRD